MKVIWSFVFSVFAMGVAISDERIIPIDNIYISVETNSFLAARSNGGSISVSVRMSRHEEAPVGSTEIDVNCFEFPAGKRMFHKADIDALREASAACEKGEAFLKEIVTKTFLGDEKTTFEAVEKNGVFMVLVSRAGSEVMFLPEESKRVDEAIKEAEIAQKWYQKLLVAKEMPTESPDARPPKARGFYLDAKLGEVLGRGIGYEVSLKNMGYFSQPSYQVGHAINFYQNGEMFEMVSGDWLKVMLKNIAEAIEAASEGRDYSYKANKDGDSMIGSYTVTANSATKEADVSYQSGKLSKKLKVREGHFGEKQLKEIRQYIEQGPVIQKWFEENESLFYKPKPAK